MVKAKTGDNVKVHYVGSFPEGEVFDTSANRDPLEFQVGSGQVIQGFEDAVIGMEPGEKNIIELVSDKAYGPHIPEMVAIVNKSDFPAHLDPKVGDKLQAPQDDGRVIVVTVTQADEDSVTVDANHPLAGKDLNFEIHLVKIS